MLAGVVEAATTFVAWRLDLMQTLGAWTSGDLSGKVAGRYELLWGVGVMTLVAWFAADRFTVAGLGRDRAVGLGLAYDRTMALGMVIVSLTSAVTVVVVGSLPFLGLVVPNMVSLVAGDSLRRSLPWMAVGGAVMVLACDVLGRLVNHPYEISVGLVMGVVGSLLFLIMLLRSTR
jgi:transport system permease protein